MFSVSCIDFVEQSKHLTFTLILEMPLEQVDVKFYQPDRQIPLAKSCILTELNGNYVFVKQNVSLPIRAGKYQGLSARIQVLPAPLGQVGGYCLMMSYKVLRATQMQHKRI